MHYMILILSRDGKKIHLNGYLQGLLTMMVDMGMVLVPTRLGTGSLFTKKGGDKVLTSWRSDKSPLKYM